MEIYKAIILGAVQGLTEFLPLSSSGHLAVAEYFLGTDGGLTFGVFMHLATLIPVLFVFKNEILSALKTPNYIKYLIVATIPAGVVGVAFSDMVEGAFSSIKFLAWSFLATALMLFLCQNLKKPKQKDINLKSSFIYGAFQAVAIFPGVSRSGSCITAGSVCGVDPSKNTAFAFIMSIPIILASTALEGVKMISSGATVIEPLPLLTGFVSALIVGFVSAKFMKRLPKNANVVFGVYLSALSLILFIC